MFLFYKASSIVRVGWNELKNYLTSADQQGTVIVHHLKDGTWTDLLTNAKFLSYLHVYLHTLFITYDSLGARVQLQILSGHPMANIFVSDMKMVIHLSFSYSFHIL